MSYISGFKVFIFGCLEILVFLLGLFIFDILIMAILMLVDIISNAKRLFLLRNKK